MCLMSFNLTTTQPEGSAGAAVLLSCGEVDSQH